MNPLRSALRSAVVLSGSAAIVALAAGPAAAADSITIKNGTTSVNRVSANATLKVTANADPNLQGGTVKLTVTDPTNATHVLDTANRSITSSTTLGPWSFDTACVAYPGSTCSGYAPARNGTWHFALSGSGSGATSDLVLAIPPAVVNNVGATADYAKVTITWNAGVEPDLTSYDVLTSDGTSVASGIDPTQACSNGACAVTIDFGPQASGTYSFIVRSERATCPSCSSTLTSPDSNAASVTISQPPPPASPSPSGSSTPDASASPGASGTPSSGSSPGGSSPPTKTRSGGSKSPPSLLNGSVGRLVPRQTLALPPPKLPALQTVLQPLPDGTYKPTLAYPEQTVQESVQQAVRKPIGLGASIERVVSRAAMVRSVAAAALLLLIAAHLRAWLARSRPE